MVLFISGTTFPYMNLLKWIEESLLKVPLLSEACRLAGELEIHILKLLRLRNTGLKNL